MARPPGVNEDGPEEHDGAMEEDAEDRSSMFEEIMVAEFCEVQDILMIRFICYFFLDFWGTVLYF